MVRRKLLLTLMISIVIAFVWLPAASLAAGLGCTIIANNLGTCNGNVGSSIGNGGVDLTIGGTAPGGASGTPKAGAVEGGPRAEEPPTPPIPWCTGMFCRDGFTVTSALEGRGPITWSDLASFRPLAGTAGMEPVGWSVVGLETNLFVDTATHEVAGELAGVPAIVRFAPVGFRFDYGDGSLGSSHQRGASWNALGVSEFAPTATSHVFERAGTFDMRSSVIFRAHYQFGPGSWVPIAGTLAVETNELNVVVERARTVLVGGDCRRNLAAPGC